MIYKKIYEGLSQMYVIHNVEPKDLFTLKKMLNAIKSFFYTYIGNFKAKIRWTRKNNRYTCRCHWKNIRTDVEKPLPPKHQKLKPSASLNRIVE